MSEPRSLHTRLYGGPQDGLVLVFHLVMPSDGPPHCIAVPAVFEEMTAFKERDPTKAAPLKTYKYRLRSILNVPMTIEGEYCYDHVVNG